MAKYLGVYKCDLCSNLVEVYQEGAGELVCCGEPMKLMEEKSADSTTEKHVPVIEKVEGGYKVTVGSTLHPMLDAHYIQWIELLTEKEVLTAFLKPGNEPVAFFCTEAQTVSAREYCNLHGHWSSGK